MGTLAGFLGAFTIALTSTILLPFCPEGSTSTSGSVFGFFSSKNDGGRGWAWREKFLWILAVTLWGGVGSLLDSALGGWFQNSVVDTRTGKVIEGAGGKKVSLLAVCSLGTGFINLFVLSPGVDRRIRRTSGYQKRRQRQPENRKRTWPPGQQRGQFPHGFLDEYRGHSSCQLCLVRASGESLDSPDRWPMNQVILYFQEFHDHPQIQFLTWLPLSNPDPVLPPFAYLPTKIPSHPIPHPTPAFRMTPPSNQSSKKYRIV